ncbi:Alkaline phosphatase synthesis transcriptional regulatory protein PhoP [Methanosarcinales archaeon]|nr:Alkaline phosphatase synthesis transcriptional regulatory protein PhoP [Methanosarcinales archaeon]
MQIKILVVDDEKCIVNTLKMSLEFDNYKVIEAYTGDGAIRKVHGEAPDLILLDIMLPDMTGYEICNKLRKDPLTRSIPIIMLTGMGETGRIAGLELGADEYITKPFDLNELKAKIRAVLDSIER